MSKPVTYLSSEFLTSCGVSITGPLRNWLNRASYLSKTRTSEADRRKYERWVLTVVEDALREPGGIEGKDWNRVSPVMPSNAEDREPALLHINQNNNATTTTTTNNNDDNNNNSINMKNSIVVGNGESAITIPYTDHRTVLFSECMKRAPAELRSFVMQAFAVFDNEVNTRKRKYENTTFLEVIQAAQELHRAYKVKIQNSHSFSIPINQQTTSVMIPKSIETSNKISSHVKVSKIHQKDEEKEKKNKKKKEEQQKIDNNNSNYYYYKDDDEEKDWKPHKMRRTEVNSSHREEYSMDLSYVEYSNTNDFFQNIISCNTVSNISRPFIGKSQELERNYSRYEPTAEDIRPRDVLIKAFDFILLKAKEKEKQESSLSSARYLDEQLKGLRQDLRVQNIVDDFAIGVYEKHALICLELGNIGEFNQCQASLKNLYDGLTETTRKTMSDFFCYRLAYLCLGGQYDALATELIIYTNNTIKGSKSLKNNNNNNNNNSTKVKKSDVRWTLKLCTACEDGDCFTICRALIALPRGMHLLIKIYLQRCRLRWLRELLASLRGVVSMRFILSCLGFTPVMYSTKNSTTGGISSSSNNNNNSNSNLFWLDGSLTEAEEATKKFFETIKFTLPNTFSFSETIKIKTAGHEGGLIEEKSRPIMIDAATLFKCVDEYINYLGTRRDARLNNVE